MFAEDWPVDLSPDGRHTWNGADWQPNPISPDGYYFWYQYAWHPVPREPASQAQAPGVAPAATAVSGDAGGTLSSQPLAQLIGVPLVWREEKADQAVLVSGDELFATLRGKRTSLLSGSGRFEALAYDGKWTFEQPSAVRTSHILIKADPSGAVVAEFSARMIRELDLTLPSGQRAGFRLKNYFLKTWEWVGPDKQPLIEMGRQEMKSWASLVQERPVQLQPAAAGVADLSLLLLLGQFLARVAETSTGG